VVDDLTLVIKMRHWCGTTRSYLVSFLPAKKTLPCVSSFDTRTRGGERILLRTIEPCTTEASPLDLMKHTQHLAPWKSTVIHVIS